MTATVVITTLPGVRSLPLIIPGWLTAIRPHLHSSDELPPSSTVSQAINEIGGRVGTVQEYKSGGCGGLGARQAALTNSESFSEDFGHTNCLTLRENRGPKFCRLFEAQLSNNLPLSSRHAKGEQILNFA